MSAKPLPIGSFVRIEKPTVQAIIDRLRELGYRTIGPRLAEGAVIYGEITSVGEIPIGWLDEQDGGRYRLQPSASAGYFDYVVGPHSLKSYFFPPQETVLECQRTDADGWQMQAPAPDEPPLAVIGPRSCDLHALRVQDRVFLEGPYVDAGYRRRREGLFVAAVNCRRAAATCFCHSMNTGPQATFGFDLALTEADDHFVVEVGSETGGQVLATAAWSPCTMEELNAASFTPLRLLQEMNTRRESAQPADDGVKLRWLDTTDIRHVLMSNLDHPRWQVVAERCLSCANCTMVCPTCFCSSVEDVSDLSGDHVHRERSWASCFTGEHSYMNSGTVRKTTASRYRQWLTHKLATWIDQFGTSGCVGCGRCITWCPVGIDLTEEVAAIRGGQS